MNMVILKCDECRETLYQYHALCPKCNGPLQVELERSIGINLPFEARQDLWRYRSVLPFSPDFLPCVTFGEGNTPLLELSRDYKNVLVKLEYKANTNSYLDRGASVSINYWKNKEIYHASTYSLSGDGAASIAAYCTSAGIQCTAWLGHKVSKEKIAQIRSYGADVVIEEFETLNEILAALKFHVILPAVDPFFIEGTKTISYEIWEQMGNNIPNA
ncbi:MAG: pyridoxal-phosphate dependent enzyme, partial [Anaerolineales bacterium]|nr:pyridoxal-phosphate dependent enzyme [Anaerolineales bacterium]